MATLHSSPFTLTLGETVDAKVIAYNKYGSSGVSVVGNGATIIAVPEAPVNLRSDGSVTSASVIGLIWEDGSTDNGDPILDYTLFYD